MSVKEKRLSKEEDKAARLFARIRKNDDVLREHFSNIKDDRAYEIRRLLKKAILAEREGK